MDDDARPKLKTLQHKAKDMESPVGKHSTRSLKEFFQSQDNDAKKKKTSRGTQVNASSILAEDLSGSMPSDEYWKVLAEKRRAALEEALDENKILWTEKKDLIKENAEYSKKLNEMLSFVDVVKDLMNEENNDTGIDVRDVSREDNE